MNKYKLYNIKKTRNHPSIHITDNKEGKWENIEITSSPSGNNKYTEFDENPNPNWVGRKAYFRRYIRKDPMHAKGEEFLHYRIVESDELKIDLFIKQNKENKLKILENQNKKHKKKTR